MMKNVPRPDVTQLLQQMSRGDAEAPAKVIPLVYEELRRLARSYLQRERLGHTLQPTAVVHEAYLRLVQEKEIDWENRSHFFAIAARVMRQILVSYARAHHTAKRGGGAHKLSLEAAEFVPQESADDLLALDEVLRDLAKVYPRQSQVVECRFFGGMDTKEIAAALNVSEKTVLRDWSFAKCWLFRELTREAGYAT
ncbi:MAG: sigma-70 family RNA polymerase sigma factor [Verrucomicrobiota bacterium]|nr:sigma-70 family RNA polymerase sigma factor [Verrucomicrobiota bacterium]